MLFLDFHLCQNFESNATLMIIVFLAAFNSFGKSLRKESLVSVNKSNGFMGLSLHKHSTFYCFSFADF